MAVIGKDPEPGSYYEAVGTNVDIALSMVDTLNVMVRGQDDRGNIAVVFWLTPEQFESRTVKGQSKEEQGTVNDGQSE